MWPGLCYQQLGMIALGPSLTRVSESWLTLPNSQPATAFKAEITEKGFFLLDCFKWTRLARMTNKEARAARVEFARSHPDLLDTPRELALALRQAQLYAEATSVRDVLKHLDAIIAAARC